MSEKSSSSKSGRRCKSRHCDELRDPDHDRCARHAPCASSGKFDPSRCNTCSKLASELVKSDPLEVKQHPYWTILRDQYKNAASLVNKYNEAELHWASEELAALFVNEVTSESLPMSPQIEQQESVGESMGEILQVLKQVTS